MTRLCARRPAPDRSRRHPLAGLQPGLRWLLAFGSGHAIGRRREGITTPWALSLAMPVGLALSLVALVAPPVRAESRTAESIWSQSDAEQRAIQQVPLADRDGITQTRCQEVGVGRMGSLPRFRCTVWFTPVKAGAPGAANPADGAGVRQP